MIGKLKNRITFNSKTSVSDSAGGFVNTLVSYYVCWAEMVSNSNSKTNITGRDSLNDAITFRIRYTTSKTFTNALVITFKSRTYMINSIINEGDLNQYFLIDCATLK
jgi:SPP1 family predicted phage head-tail adaptor